MNIFISEIRAQLELSVQKFEQNVNASVEKYVQHENQSQLHKMLVEMTPELLQKNYVEDKNFNAPALDELQNYERMLAVSDGGKH